MLPTGLRDFHARRRAQVALRCLDHQREMQRLLVWQHLPFENPMLAVELPVVGDEDEHGPVELAGLATAW
jgi:hypothetical protein